MIGLYFSGTGNTKHCVETFVRLNDESGTSLSIESQDALSAIAAHEVVVLGYPIYFSNMPKIMRDFLGVNSAAFAHKRVFIIATMGLFSGDGAGCATRLMKRYGASVIGGLHLKMPDCIGDEKLLKKTLEENQRIVAAAEEKIAAAVERLKAGKPPKDGLSPLHHVAGLFGQRLWFYSKTTTYKNAPKIDSEKCSGCGLCAKLCPMNNLEINNGKTVASNRCTMCYRCFSHCPQKALTILGKRVYEQCLFKNYQ